MGVAFWTEEKVEALRKFWPEGHSASQIGLWLGCTRNSVIGKVHRIGLQLRGQTKAGGRKPRLRPRPRPLRAKPISPLQKLIREGGQLPPRAETDIARVSFSDLEDGKHCKFIPGDPKDFKPDTPMYCGAQPELATHYCKHHLVRCHSPPELKMRISIPASIKQREFA